MYIRVDANNYVFECISYREPDCKYPKTKKTCIGKNDENGNFIGNKYYNERCAKEKAEKKVSELEEKVRMFEKEKKETVREEKAIEKATQIAVSSRKKSGLTYALLSIAEHLGITASLEELFGKEKTLIFLSLVQYMISSKSGAMDDFSFFHSDHTHASGKDITSPTISRVFSSITEENVTHFFKYLNKNAPKDYKFKNCYASFDSTAFSSYSDDIDIVAPSKGKQDPDLEHFSLSAVYDTRTHMCGYYRLYRGNIPDIKTVKDLTDVAKAMGFTFNNKLIFDRGYTSWENIYYINKTLKCDCLMMLKSNLSIYNNALIKAGTAFKEDPLFFIPSQGVFGTTVTDDITLLVDGKEERIHAFVHIYFSPERYSKEYVELEDAIDFEIERVTNLINDKAISITDVKNKTAIIKSISKYIKVRNTSNTRVCLEKDNEAIKEKLKKSGYFAIFSTEYMSAKDALLTYRGRDNVERLFNIVKNDLGFTRAEVKNDNTLQGKIFLVMIAATIISYIKSSLRANRQKLTRKLTYNKALLELEGIYTHEIKGMTVYSEISERQKLILECLGLESPGKEITVKVKRVHSKKLTKR